MFIKHAFLSLTIITCILFSQLSSQTVEPKFDTLGPIVIPNCVFQDSYGFIWIGAQEGLVRYDGYNLKRYTQIPFDSTSLSNNWVWAIKEDKKGNLWVGTFGGGLNYFDQKTEKFYYYLYETDKPDEISSLNISSILVNEDGSLWIGTQNHGLLYMNLDYSGKASYKTYNLSRNSESPDSRGENFVLCLHKDQTGQLWIGTIVGGLKLLNPETGDITHFKHDPQNPASLSNNTISSICEDNSGNLWIGTGHYMAQLGNGLNKYDPISKKFIHFKHDPEDPASLSSNIILSLLIDRAGIMWIGTLGNKLNSIPIAELLSDHTPQFTHHTNFDRSNINSVYEDRLGNIWVAPFGRAIHIYNRNQNPFIWYRHIKGNPNSLWSSASVVQVDKSGNIWFGGGAIDCYNPESGQYRHYYRDSDNQSGLSLKNITSICEDKYRFLWIGTYNGLHRLDPMTGTFFHIFKSPNDPFALRSNIIDEVLTSRSGDLWVASAKSGLQLYDIDAKKFYHFDLDTTSRNDGNISGIYEDYSGTLWIQTINHGLYALRIKENLITYTKHYIHNPNDRNSLSYNLITDIIRPQIIDTSAVWIATGNGLNRLDLTMETFTHFYIENGLPSNHILKILEDDKGNIWCTCATGLAVYNIKTGMIKSYGKGDGMPTVEFGSRAQNACKTPDGQLIFGAAIGALGFYPEQFIDNAVIPLVHLTEFKIFHESVKLDTAIQFINNISLEYDQNAFSFEFAALNFTNPKKNQYAYKMEGFHDDWIQCGTEHIASFTNLDPGNYVFRVKGSNNHGVWNEVGTSVNVIIQPPWWKTGWAYFTYILFLGTVLIGSVRFEIQRRQRKIENKLKQEQELLKLEQANHRVIVAELQTKTAEAQKEIEKEQIRSRIASDLHDEIGSNLSSIALISQIVEEKSKLQKSMKLRLQESQRIARLTAESMRDIVWFINPTNDDMEKLIIKMRATANLLIEDKDFTFKTPKEGITFQGDLNFRRNLFLIFKESLQNIIKHANATKVEIIFDQTEDKFSMHIRDNGRGFDVHQTYSGSGLKNFKSRAQEMGAKFEIKSEKGKGTEIMLSAKIP